MNSLLNIDFRPRKDPESISSSLLGLKDKSTLGSVSTDSVSRVTQQRWLKSSPTPTPPGWLASLLPTQPTFPDSPAERSHPCQSRACSLSNAHQSKIQAFSGNAKDGVVSRFLLLQQIPRTQLQRQKWVGAEGVVSGSGAREGTTVPTAQDLNDAACRTWTRAWSGNKEWEQPATIHSFVRSFIIHSGNITARHAWPRVDPS